MNLNELKAAAEAATDEEMYGYHGDGYDTPFMDLFLMRCRPATILKLLAVVEAAKCCLEDVVLQEEIMGIRNALKELEK
jgi:hypothetical protein